MHALPRVEQLVGSCCTELNSVLCDDLEQGIVGWEEAQEGRGVCVYMAGFILLYTETNTAL